MKHRKLSDVIMWLLLVVGIVISFTAFADSKTKPTDFDHEAIVKEASEFFGVTSEELAKVLAKAFKEKGKPNAFIKGEEASGALGLGLRFGRGELQTIEGHKRKLEWDGPSIGFDIGLNASKVLILVYHLKNPDDIYQKFTGVEGSVYFVAGAGINYLEAGDMILAPVRVGVGWRQGANVGFLRFKDADKKDAI